LIGVLESTNKELAEENRRLKTEIAKSSRFTSIIGNCGAMQKVFAMLEKVLDSDVTVLITGETGTGKEVVANAIHRNSHRARGPFVAQNCAAMPEQLLESELFGFKRGAFTGANQDKKGLLEAAHGGTIFLDEIGDMPIGLQAKILRVLQEGEVRPLGSLESRKVDIRVLAATHQDLEARIAEGQFREDLFYRLNVFPIHLPPLRDRQDDVPAL
ncbi:MAG: sigma-54 factor interaction domain-containing protein, partial [Nisaea sp.]|uniref:sigma-54 factor interaction domain-containing protein n=1 Tax=Nisaea sp. TaxID=2024842 RepID=UPI001B2D6628